MNKLQQFIQSQPCGFLTSREDEDTLIALDRLFPMLVRCGGCRFTCAAQDIRHLVKCVEAGGDYVRDVSFPVGAFERAASWQPEPNYTDAWTREAKEAARPEKQRPSAWCINRGTPHFNENDCGGAFDGNQVTSDADPGL